MERIPINAGTVEWSGENPGMYLKDSFVAHFGAFKGVPALACCRFENGREVAGRPFPRDVAGKASSTAFLAFSETWVRR